ncbi:unnamed protein product [Protopolystoma xenopodis]|uniref:GRF-type domain-containing protein n=1 Tax=Protopolystoma xenopodis TaxID=117903 RepID=A0A3S5B973_9PLAT|nr:unnamed protein product [Protopolystoma xenopodis]
MSDISSDPSEPYSKLVSSRSTFPLRQSSASLSEEVAPCVESIATLEGGSKNADTFTTMSQSDLLAICDAADADRARRTELAWRNLLACPSKPPLCFRHQEPCVLRIVKRTGSNHFGRQFWVCSRPQGVTGNPAARCQTFLWADEVSRGLHKTFPSVKK